MISSGNFQSAAIFWNNSSETWIDVEINPEKVTSKSKDTVSNVKTHWVSESGAIDLFVLMGPSIDHVAKQYASLTGLPALPPVIF